MLNKQLIVNWTKWVIICPVISFLFLLSCFLRDFKNIPCIPCVTGPRSPPSIDMDLRGLRGSLSTSDLFPQQFVSLMSNILCVTLPSSFPINPFLFLLIYYLSLPLTFFISAGVEDVLQILRTVSRTWGGSSWKRSEIGRAHV